MTVKYFDWDDAKNAKLRAERGIGFEDVVFHIERGDLLDILEHPNPDRYGGQRIAPESPATRHGDPLRPPPTHSAIPIARKTFQLPSWSFLSTASTVPRTCVGSPAGDGTYEAVK